MKSKRVFLHRKLSELLKKDIREGKYKPDEYIPSERELCERYSLSRTTVRRAISQLVSEGFLHSTPGSGTFVSEVALQKRLQLRPSSKNVLCVSGFAGYSPLESPYYSKIFSYMQQEFALRGYHLSFYYFTDESKPNFVSIVKERNLAGAILVGTIKQKIILDIFKNYIPIVTIDNYVSNKNVTAIVPDNRKGAFEATKYLIGLGHKKIYFIGANFDDPLLIERINGCKDALAEAAIPFKGDCFIKSYLTVPEGRLAMGKILSGGDLPTAIFAFNDETAIGAMEAIHEKSKLRIPQDISIVGFDDIDWAAHTNPPLTTVRIQKEKAGEMAAKFLIEQIEDNKSTNIKIVTPAELVIRSSCSSPRQK